MRPRIHLANLARRQAADDVDQEFDVGNLCLLDLLGFTAAELSQMDSQPAPDNLQLRLVTASGQTSWYPPSTARGTWEPPPSRSSSPSPRNKAACGRVTQWHCSAWPAAPVPA
ncbi:hypothetical protein GCM10010317_050250 [Streptomyces mirabilis]|nr:hypothetical protein GCM10010317_050250 [Streptomyces mirabilis]